MDFNQAEDKISFTWEAAEECVSVVASIKDLQWVPVLLRDKADYLDLRDESKH